MCGDNMLEDDVKKTSENGGENGMIEESAIVISHSTRPGVCLSFQIATFFTHYFSFFFMSLDNTPAIWSNRNLSRRQGVFFFSKLNVLFRHDCNASTPIKLNYFIIFFP